MRCIVEDENHLPVVFDSLPKARAYAIKRLKKSYWIRAISIYNANSYYGSDSPYTEDMMYRMNGQIRSMKADGWPVENLKSNH